MFRHRGVFVWQALIGVSLATQTADAQIGGLIKKATKKAAEVEAAVQPDTYTDILLELKEDQLLRVIAGRKAGQAFAASPRGPRALRARHQEAFSRADQHRQQHASLIEAWEERLRLQRNCVDSAFVALDELRSNELGQRMMNVQNDPAFRQKMIQLAPRIAAAQVKAAQGDSTDLIRINAELAALNKPTPADSANVRQRCALPDPPEAISQLQPLQDAVDRLARELAEAEGEVARLEEQASGMDRKQLAMACERILRYLEQLKAKKAQQGFSQAELDALGQHLDDIRNLCD